MKKIISVLLCLSILAGIIAVASPMSFAAADGADIPVVHVVGTGSKIIRIDENGEEETLYPIQIPENYINEKAEVILPVFAKAFFTQEWGEFLSTPESWTDEYYQIVYNDAQFGLQSDLYEDPENWNSFNDFFARHLSSPDKRPITAPDNNSVVVAPADSEPQGVWNIDETSMIVQKEDELVIKSKEFNSIADLIGPDSQYRDAFANGTMTHTFLDVHNYHRYHFPVSGTIKEVPISRRTTLSAAG